MCVHACVCALVCVRVRACAWRERGVRTSFSPKRGSTECEFRFYYYRHFVDAWRAFVCVCFSCWSGTRNAGCVIWGLISALESPFCCNLGHKKTSSRLLCLSRQGGGRRRMDGARLGQDFDRTALHDYGPCLVNCPSWLWPLFGELPFTVTTLVW